MFSRISKLFGLSLLALLVVSMTGCSHKDEADNTDAAGGGKASSATGGGSGSGQGMQQGTIQRPGAENK